MDISRGRCTGGVTAEGRALCWGEPVERARLRSMGFVSVIIVRALLALGLPSVLI